eukprot:TRINITY_DN15309_c0_g1_i1.p1 TRINITY_DN15309_c0_g1~~TRINITY_DN15309_c0_g1_i1.p1  ORF type:complete len:157 (-),score=24.63 TRINITY_DN15309_c0_g1_i1:88-558(-)
MTRWYFFFFFKQKTAYEIMPSLVGSEMCIRDSNAEYMGQGPWVGMDAYLRDDAFKSNPPKVIIWEIPERELRSPPNYKYRDTRYIIDNNEWVSKIEASLKQNQQFIRTISTKHKQICLLYTSDAADDMQCVDLGGRRITKKKKPTIHNVQTSVKQS